MSRHHYNPAEWNKQQKVLFWWSESTEIKFAALSMRSKAGARKISNVISILFSDSYIKSARFKYEKVVININKQVKNRKKDDVLRRKDVVLC